MNAALGVRFFDWLVDVDLAVRLADERAADALVEERAEALPATLRVVDFAAARLDDDFFAAAVEDFFRAALVRPDALRDDEDLAVERVDLFALAVVLFLVPALAGILFCSCNYFYSMAGAPYLIDPASMRNPNIRLRILDPPYSRRNYRKS